MAVTMAVLGAVQVAAALAEVRRRAPTLRRVPHLTMGAAMIGVHVADHAALWAAGAVQAAGAVWAGTRQSGHGRGSAAAPDGGVRPLTPMGPALFPAVVRFVQQEHLIGAPTAFLKRPTGPAHEQPGLPAFT